MTTPFDLNQDELARGALALREAMLNFKSTEHPYTNKIIDTELLHLNPILDLCIAKGLEEPFDLVGYMNPRIFGDWLAYSELTKPYYELVNLMKGGLKNEAFWQSEYSRERLMPRQLRVPYVPEYAPSQKTLDAINKPLPPNIS